MTGTSALGITMVSAGVGSERRFVSCDHDLCERIHSAVPSCTLCCGDGSHTFQTMG